LRRLAAQRLAAERSAQTLQATALVHEASLRLVDSRQVQRFNGCGHFFARADEAIRRILVEDARKRGCSNEVAAISHRYRMPRPVGRKREMRCLANAPALG
jgi:hypothetical protein